MLISCWVYGKDMYYKKHPITTFSELYSPDPERFYFKKDTFNFGYMINQYYLLLRYVLSIDDFTKSKCPIKLFYNHNYN